MENKDGLKELMEKLSAPFTVKGVDGKTYFAHKWRVQSFLKDICVCVPYLDARQVTERLNDVLGINGWENQHIEVSGEGILCEISIIINGNKFRRSDIGTPSNVEKEKGMVSDSIKRAAVHFGIGRYLYDIEPIKLKYKEIGNKKYPIDKNGNVLYTGDALSSYINMMNPLGMKLTEIFNSFNEENKVKLKENFTAIWKALNS